jgi:hypothetical protein
MFVFTDASSRASLHSQRMTVNDTSRKGAVVHPGKQKGMVWNEKVLIVFVFLSGSTMGRPWSGPKLGWNQRLFVSHTLLHLQLLVDSFT